MKLINCGSCCESASSGIHRVQLRTQSILSRKHIAPPCPLLIQIIHLFSGNNRLFLTLLGGGAFGNKTDWITEGIKRALKLYEGRSLEIAIVNYGASRQYVWQLVEQLS
ncbi:MAG: hypothetical protein MRK01_02645 [Candidatus Scalindua sp.]|nr:hypothetical protein [Candidatus Scalindua sp.]